MKKCLVFGFLIICFIFINYLKPTYAYSCEETKEVNINTNNLINYLGENKISNVYQICSNEYCLDVKNIYQDLDFFINSYIEKIKVTDTDSALMMEYKGFIVDKLVIKKC